MNSEANYDAGAGALIQMANKAFSANEIYSGFIGPQTVVLGGQQEASDTMTTPSREEIDARLETAAAKMDGRIEVIEIRMDGRLASIEAKMEANFARFDSALHKTTADTVKWVVGTIVAVGAVGLSIMTFLINNIAPKVAAQPAPIIITVPMPVPTASPPAK